MVASAAPHLADPFGELTGAKHSVRLHLLGASILFESDTRQLLRLVQSAYAGLPRHRLPGSVPQLRIRLVLALAEARCDRREPLALTVRGGLGLLGGATGATSMVMLSPPQRAALIVVSPTMLRSPYHARYELIEFAVFALAARVQELVPLHAACFGQRNCGVLLMGGSGAGKSTLALQAALRGWEFIAEDAVFVAPGSMHATGVANFLHVGVTGLKWVGLQGIATQIREAPIIRRRSGVRKFEVDLRRLRCRVAPRPLKLAAAVFLSPLSAGRGPLLRPLSRTEWNDRLMLDQPYAAHQAGWREFTRGLSRLDVMELRRGSHPAQGLDSLQLLLARGTA